MNLMKSHHHLLEVDAFAGRSCLYLMSIHELIECSNSINTELLDILYVFNGKAPQEISYGNFQVGVKTFLESKE